MYKVINRTANIVRLVWQKEDGQDENVAENEALLLVLDASIQGSFFFDQSGQYFQLAGDEAIPVPAPDRRTLALCG